MYARYSGCPSPTKYAVDASSTCTTCTTAYGRNAMAVTRHAVRWGSGTRGGRPMRSDSSANAVIRQGTGICRRTVTTRELLLPSDQVGQRGGQVVARLSNDTTSPPSYFAIGFIGSYPSSYSS